MCSALGAVGLSGVEVGQRSANSENRDVSASAMGLVSVGNVIRVLICSYENNVQIKAKTLSQFAFLFRVDLVVLVVSASCVCGCLIVKHQMSK